jgi:hypothetical protein
MTTTARVPGQTKNPLPLLYPPTRTQPTNGEVSSKEVAARKIALPLHWTFLRSFNRDMPVPRVFLRGEMPLVVVSDIFFIVFWSSLAISSSNRLVSWLVSDQNFGPNGILGSTPSIRSLPGVFKAAVAPSQKRERFTATLEKSSKPGGTYLVWPRPVQFFGTRGLAKVRGTTTAFASSAPLRMWGPTK